MIQKVSRTAEIYERLEREGKVSYLDQPEHIAAIDAMSDQMEEVRREYQVKDRNSQVAAASVILIA
ncbi:hypothetical protein [Pedobacter sp. ok626]|uniref:hypothetical protein n=1 Tax=Pedobacter sp. ok626 TaxID=1761882 RepID=UPI000B83B575|nr:hypothetical protein [Pedobacter sp. ok626]